MIRYSLKSLLTRRPGAIVLLPIIERSIGAEVAYLRALRVVLRELHKAVKTDVLPVVERELAQSRALLVDVDSAVFERIRLLARALGLVAEKVALDIFTLEGERHTKKFMTTAKNVLGIDLTTVVKAADLTAFLETAATLNAGLIKGLTDYAIQKIQTTVTTAVLQGIPADALRKQLTADFGFADSRARLIARDQISKTTADFNRIRHLQAGVTDYIWRTSRDERVRPRHVKCNGLRYKYGQPTAAENGLPPGQPVQCRCIAQGVVEF